MSLIKCDRCSEFFWKRTESSSCSCRAYEVAVHEWDVTYDYEKGKRVEGSMRLEYSTVYAMDAEKAATKYVEGRDDEYIVINSEVTVTVRRGDDSHDFRVAAEMIANYYGTEI